MLDFCAWCGKHITPLMFNSVYIKGVRRTGYWFCSLRCYTAWDVKFRSERRTLNLNLEGRDLHELLDR